MIDDERAIRRFLKASLTALGCTIFQAASGREGLEAVVAKRPDLVILDLGLPDIEGIDVICQLREWSQIPIIILSVREWEGDKIAALDAGADDYLTKPFGVGELMARLRAALRRAIPPSSEPIFMTGELKVDMVGRVVTVAGVEAQLTPTEYDLLKLFVTNAGKVLTHQQILRQVWGVGYVDELHLLRVNVSNLRRKIELDPSRPHYIVTEPGVGYRLRLDT